jgi:hypothetical protein
MPLIEFPDVPDVPGVPPLARSAISQVAAGINGYLALAGLPPLIALPTPTWGVFDDSGLAVAVADSVIAMDYHSESRVSDYPQEMGAFESFNKVQVPYASSVQMTCGGDSPRRATFLAALQAAKDSTNLYSIVTPDVVYRSANITGLNYRRTTRDGASLLTVDLHFEEIRVTASAAFANENVQNPASADTVSLGQVQAQPPSAGMSALFGPVSAVQGIGGA